MTDQELIRWAAEKVMGWREVLDTSSQQYFWEDTFGNWHFPVHGYDRFNPLHDLNHAFMVVGKMKENGWSVHIEDGPHILSRCRFFNISYHPDWVNLEYLGHAICLAALEAVRMQSAEDKSPQ